MVVKEDFIKKIIQAIQVPMQEVMIIEAIHLEMVKRIMDVVEVGMVDHMKVVLHTLDNQQVQDMHIVNQLHLHIHQDVY